MKKHFRKKVVSGWRSAVGILSGVLVFLFALHSSLTTVYAQSCKPVPVGLVSWYPGDGNTLDVRSRTNGTLQNGATFAAGQVGQSSNLDGIDDFVSAPDSASLNFGTGAFSIEFWVNFNSTAGEQILVEKYVERLDSTSTGFTLTKASNNSILMAFTGGGVFQSFPLAILPNTWYHIAATRDASGTASIYLNGTFVAGNTNSSNVDSTSSLKLGHRGNPTDTPGSLDTRGFYLNGRIDEVSLYNRSLAPNEITSIVNAGSAGKCKPTATAAPNGLVGWWPGDGNANDIAGTNNGTLQNGAGFAVGKVGQSFWFDGINDVVQIPDSPDLNFSQTSPMSVEVWVYRTSGLEVQHFIGKRTGNCLPTSINYNYQLALNTTNGQGLLFAGESGGTGTVASSGQDLPVNTWTHLAGTFDGFTLRLYINGVLSATANGTIGAPNAAPLLIGGSGACNVFGGQIDEPAIFNRVLTPTEITSIYNAGVAGKLKDNATPTGANVSVNTRGDATVTFPNVSTAGTTQEIPLDASLFPPLPPGSFTGLAYDIATSASFTGNPTVCFNLPSFTPAQFANLRVVHFESGNWVMQTANSNTFPTLCSVPLSSLSPFAIVQVAPSAASVSVSGRVLTSDGRGLRNAIVTLTNRQGGVRNARSSSFGYYRFDDVRVGETYIIGGMSKQYRFAPQIISVADEMTEVNLVAEAAQERFYEKALQVKSKK